MRASRCTKAAVGARQRWNRQPHWRDGKRKSERERCFVLSHAAVCIVNLEAADIELDDDYRVARYSWKMRAREKEWNNVRKTRRRKGGGGGGGEGEERNRTRPLLETMPPWTTSGKCIFKPRLSVGDLAQPSCLHFCSFSLSQLQSRSRSRPICAAPR